MKSRAELLEPSVSALADVVTRLALTVLGTNAASLRAAYDKGMLSASRISAKGSAIAMHADAVRQFAAQYAYTSKRSAELGISENVLLETLKLRTWFGFRGQITGPGSVAAG